MATYVLLHGSNQGGWIWQPVVNRLRAAGHQVYAPSLDGCGERKGQMRPGITAETQADEVAQLMFYEDLSDVVGMHPLNVEGKNPKPSLPCIEQLETGNAGQPVNTIAGQCLLVLDDVVASELFNEVDSGAEANRAGNVRGAGLETVRRLLVFGLVEGNVQDHLAPTLPGRHRLQESRLADVRHGPIPPLEFGPA